MRHTDLARAALTAVLAVCCQSAFAKCGGVDYSWGADGLAKAHDFVITMLLYVVYVCYAVAGIVSVIASLQIYFKINAGEEGWKKEIMMVVVISILIKKLVLIIISIVFFWLQRNICFFRMWGN